MSVHMSVCPHFLGYRQTPEDRDMWGGRTQMGFENTGKGWKAGGGGRVVGLGREGRRWREEKEGGKMEI